jgi:hypothetical protein
MIDKDAFSAGMALLAGAFGREIDAPVGRAYFAVLNPQLTTEQFERAVQLTLVTEKFWPAPAVLLGKIFAGPNEAAERALRSVNAMIDRYGGVQFVPYASWLEFDPPTKAAVLDVGGLAKIAGTPEEKWPALQRRFADAYQRAATVANSERQLRVPTTDERVKQLTSNIANALDMNRDA